MSTPVREQYIIDREGNKTAIILSIEQYEQMLEDLHDLAIIAERRAEQPVSLAKMQKWLKEDGISSC
jgi:PHD/YefM family antitoxin component YafN of YafNO toxin-antitoxin module